MSHHDVVILGGGPAGTALALELKRHAPDLKILIAEAAIATDWRIGETLAPGASQLLNGLGCWDHILRDGPIEGVRSQAAWGSDRPHAHDFVFSTRGNAWHLDRASFDEALRKATEAAGVEVWRGARFLSAVAGLVRWRLSLDREGQRIEIGARFVADATGRSARFATSQGSRRCFADRLVGVAAMVRLREGAICDHATLVEACETGWWYSTALPDGLMVLAWMSDSDIVHDHCTARLGPWLAQLRAAPLTAARAAKAESAERIFTWPARSHCLDHASGRNWVAVGDAASSWDPLSSAGIMKALRSGKLGAFVLLDAIRGVDGGARYRRLIEAEYRHYRRDRRTVYRMERRWSGSAFWQRRHAAEPFDREPAMHFAGEP